MSHRSVTEETQILRFNNDSNGLVFNYVPLKHSKVVKIKFYKKLQESRGGP